MSIKTTQKSGSLHLTKKTEYGLFLLTILAKKEKNKHFSIKQIADENHIPVAFLQKIANDLQKKNLIKSERGKYGGHILAKPAKKISIREIIEALEGEIAIAPCLKPGTKCPRTNCCIKKFMQTVNDEIKNHFLSKTIEEIIC